MSPAYALPAALLLAGVACVPASTPSHTPPPSLEARFRAELDRLREELRFPGATAAYVLPDGAVGVAATGLADAEAATPMTPHTRMLAASVGKSFVAATAVALASEGRVDLDAPIGTWLADRPWFARLPNHDTITLRHLLTHTAGLPDHVYTPAFAHDVARWWREPGSSLPPEALVGYVLDAPALAPAGERWAYSDTGYVLVGLILTQLTGQPYDEEIRRRFVEPLGLGATSASDRHALPGLAAGYTEQPHPFGLPRKTTTAPGVMAWNPAIESAGGGLVSTARDLAVWAAALYEGRAMSGAYLDELLRSVPVGGEDSGVRYGAGVAIHAQTPYGPSYGHGGTIPGYSSSMRYYPEHRVAVAFQLNADTEAATSSVEAMERRLADVILRAASRQARRP